MYWFHVMNIGRPFARERRLPAFIFPASTMEPRLIAPFGACSVVFLDVRRFLASPELETS